MRFPKLPLALAASLFCGTAALADAPANIVSLLSAAPDNSWVKLNTNSFLDAVPAESLRAGSALGADARPGSVIYAWSGFAWDSKRSQLMIYGGGHANYAGNEMYLWNAATQQWKLGSLPSQVKALPGVNGSPNYGAVDGALNAPSSAHTYDNSNYLAASDRFMTFGGAAFNSGGSYTLETGPGTARYTGPYTFDPSKADGTKVGGTTGSGVDPSTLGGNMWQNRDLVAQGVAGRQFVEGTSAAYVENGKDVVLFTARSGGTVFSDLYKLTINDINDPSLDSVQRVGAAFSGVGGAITASVVGSGAYDPMSKLYVSFTGGTGLMAWDLDSAGVLNPAFALNPTVVGSNFGTSNDYGIDWDPNNNQWLIWGGGGSVWSLKAPTAGTIAGSWSLTQIADDVSFAATAAPADRSTTGIRGKWDYVPELGVFIGLEDSDQGNVWAFRPAGFTAPVPEPSSWLLMGGGLAGLVSLKRRRRQDAR